MTHPAILLAKTAARARTAGARLAVKARRAGLELAFFGGAAAIPAGIAMWSLPAGVISGGLVLVAGAGTALYHQDQPADPAAAAEVEDNES